MSCLSYASALFIVSPSLQFLRDQLDAQLAEFETVKQSFSETQAAKDREMDLLRSQLSEEQALFQKTLDDLRQKV